MGRIRLRTVSRRDRSARGDGAHRGRGPRGGRASESVAVHGGGRDRHRPRWTTPRCSRRRATTPTADAVSAAPPPLAPGEDPPLDRVLNAWPSSVIERRAKRAGMTPHALRAAAKDADAMMMKKKKKKKKNAAAAAFAFEERRSRGASVPSSLRADLLRELVRARWPPVSHRPKVNSERYLVVAADVRGETEGRGRGPRSEAPRDERRRGSVSRFEKSRARGASMGGPGVPVRSHGDHA